ncbi:helix-turn-helix transcriptional regulator [Desulfoscipio gibsoniae]
MNLKKGLVFIRHNLKQARINKGYTQQQMAKMLGYKSKSQYCMIENGQRGVSVEKAKKISEILELPIEYLFFSQNNIHVA